MARSLELPYDGASRCAARYAWFEALRAKGWAVFLDSGDPARSGVRFDILAAGPKAMLVSRADAFAAVRRLVEGERCADTAWPVSGGAIGYLGYELGRASAGLPREKAGCEAFMPEVAMGLYPWTVVIDHVGRRAAITSLDSFSDTEAARLRDELMAAEAR